LLALFFSPVVVMAAAPPITAPALLDRRLADDPERDEGRWSNCGGHAPRLF
jgi:hypothetical protein